MRFPSTLKSGAAALASVGAVGACAGTVAAAPLAAAQGSAARTVLVKDDSFTPRKMTVPKNTTLNFQWRGSAFHNVAIGRKIIFANRTEGEATYVVRRSVVFNCTLHRASGMKLTVKVR